MENKTLTGYFKNLSLQDVWEGDFGLLSLNGMPPGQLKHLKDVCEKIPTDLYNFLVEKDPLYCDIYGNGVLVGQEQHFTFPFIVGKRIPDGIQEVVGPIGTQTSKYHQENLQQHVELVAENLFESGFDESLAIALALLHDVGKKYTSATNTVGGVCFYNHHAVSAFISGHWLRRSTKNEKLAKETVAIVYGHIFPYTEWNVKKHWKTGEPVDYKNEFYGTLLRFMNDDVAAAYKVISSIEAFSKCDEGVIEFNEAIYEKIARGHDLICNYS